jgi:hypothetical protein
MNLSREELLEAWITLAKIIDQAEIDECDEQFIRTTLNILDRLREKA